MGRCGGWKRRGLAGFRSTGAIAEVGGAGSAPSCAASPLPGSSLHTGHTQPCRAGPPGRHWAWQVLVTNTAHRRAGHDREGPPCFEDMVSSSPLSLQPLLTDWELRAKVL